ncbi:hypothetical protein ACFSKM_06025 [Ancylobacter dichloromethanicus]
MTTITSRAAGAVKTGLVALTLLTASVGLAAAHGGGFGGGGFHGGGGLPWWRVWRGAASTAAATFRTGEASTAGGFHGGGFPGGFHGGGFPGGFHGGYFPHGAPFHFAHHGHHDHRDFVFFPFFDDYAFGPYSSYLDDGPYCGTYLVKVGRPHHYRYVRETNCG